jgi:hypothetical protein
MHRILKSLDNRSILIGVETKADNLAIAALFYSEQQPHDLIDFYAPGTEQKFKIKLPESVADLKTYTSGINVPIEIYSS